MILQHVFFNVLLSPASNPFFHSIQPLLTLTTLAPLAPHHLTNCLKFIYNRCKLALFIINNVVTMCIHGGHVHNYDTRHTAANLKPLYHARYFACAIVYCSMFTN